MLLKGVHNDEGFFRKRHVHLLTTITDAQLLAFSALRSNEERFAFVYRLPAAGDPYDLEVADGGKDVALARTLKDNGNKAFQAKDYRAALKLYSQSILRTPWGPDSTAEVAVAVANRSATLYHLEEHRACLEDIELVLALDYPPGLTYKVLDRKARCLLARKQLKDALGAFQEMLTALDRASIPKESRHKRQLDVQIMLAMLGKDAHLTNAITNDVDVMLPPPLSGGSNPEFPSASTAVQIRESPDMGRFAEATRSIAVGEVLVTEPAYCAVLLAEHTSTHCFHCFRRLVYPVPCPRCARVAFCSLACQRTALATHHGVECAVLPTLWASGASVTCLMALRMVSQRGLRYFLDLRPRLGQAVQGKHDSDYLSVYQLVCHEGARTPDDLLHRAHMAVFLLQCLQAGGYFGRQASCVGGGATLDEEYVGGLLLRHLQLLQFNAHEVSELQLEVRGQLDTGRSVFLGGGLYPTLALFNHSCDPGLVRYFQGTAVVARAIRPVDAGEGVGENYGPVFTTTTRDARQRGLRDQYWFECTCTACVQDWPLFEDMSTRDPLRFRCKSTGCTNVIPVAVDTMEVMVACTWCNGYTNILKGLKVLQSTDAMFWEARTLLACKNVSRALDVLCAILRELDGILAPPYRDYHLCQQAIRECLLSLGNVAARDP